MTDWAAKVLEGVPRYGTDPDDCDGFIPTKDGTWLDYDEVLAAIARMGAGDGLVEALGKIVAQKKTTELETEYDVECADFEGGYDAIIDVARAALAKIKEPQHG